MKAKTATTEQDAKEQALEHPPADWRDPDGDGRKVPTRDAIAWRIFCRGGGASAMALELPGLTTALTTARTDLAKATARLSTERAAELGPFIASTEERIAEFTVIVEAAGGKVETVNGKVKVSGGWIGADQRALDRAVGQAEFELREAAGRVDPYRERWPPIPDFEKRFAAELREVAQAQAALKAAQKAAADNLALLEADREQLRKLRQRAA